MLLIAAALNAAIPTPAVAAPDSPQVMQPKAGSQNCPRTTGYYAWQRGAKVAPRKLGELPDANLYYTVYRTVNGCESPVVVRYRVSDR